MFFEYKCEIASCLFLEKKGQMLKKKSLSLFTVVTLEKLIFRQIIIVKLCGKSDRNNLCKLSMKTVSEFFRENQIKSGWGSDCGNRNTNSKREILIEFPNWLHYVYVTLG